MNDLGDLAVVVAHPGHELVIYRLMELHAASYNCLTDGSGGDGQPRTESTSRLLRGLEITPGPLLGRYSDKELYRDLLDQRVDVFLAMRDELAQSLMDANITSIAGDAMEGFNPAHDLCRALIDSAVAMTRDASGREIANYEFSLEPSPSGALASNDVAIRVQLDGAALDRKIAAARAYPEMQAEVERVLGGFGRQAIAIECLRPSSTAAMMLQFERTPPRYEELGLMRVGEGRYSEVIRYRQHILPLLEAIGIRSPIGAWTI